AFADHRLQLDVLVQPLRAELAADARLLETAEGTTDVERVHVDAVGAGTHARGDLEAVGDVARPHRSGQTVVAVVGDTDRVGLVAVGQHAEHGTEYFLAGDTHVVGDVGEQRRPHVPALSVRRVLAAKDHPGALFHPGPDVVLNPGLLALGNQRPDVGRLVGGIANLQARHHVGQRVDNLIAAPLADQDAGLRHAGLAVVHQARGLQALDRPLDVCVVDD